MPFVSHPWPEQKKNQELMLTQFEGKEKRSHELFFSYGNAAFIYHRQGLDNVNEEYFEMYLESLIKRGDTKLASHFKEIGFLNSVTSVPFTRFVQELNDVGLEKFIIDRMGIDDYKEYKNLLG